MKSFVSSMTILPRAFIAAIVKSLLRGQSLVRLIFAFLTSASTSPLPPSLDAVSSTAATTTTTTTTSNSSTRSIEDFLREAEELILGPFATAAHLLSLSTGLAAQFRHALTESDISMLPSYTHRVPSGLETGRFLAIDMGGTTLRIALVELRGRDAERDGAKACEVLRANVLKADDGVKDLVGMAFFEWMADRILETVSGNTEGAGLEDGEPLPIALTWSFPLQQTSIKNGLILGMGKGFRAADGLIDQDLGDLIKAACASRGLAVTLEAILNDSTACLLSQSYAHPSTRLALILGTGCNMAAFLPVASIRHAKFGDRPASWFDEAGHVVVNTELGMYGKDVLPLTRWDEQLKSAHEKPWFQPLEHMVSGMYLGECVRLALVEAIETTGIFGGVVPESLRKGYSLHTETLSLVESDDSPKLEKAIAAFTAAHPSTSPLTPTDMHALKTLSSLTARRSAAIIATCAFTLWRLRSELSLEHNQTLLPPTAASDDEEAVRREVDREAKLTSMAFNGAVIESYPGYLGMCQAYLDELVGDGAKVGLVEARDSSLLGAAVAVACEAR